jgi:Polyketide cyclase / dehydrase and lipid transport
MSEKYSFVTRWQLRATINDVWNAIYESTEWPQWWKGVKDVKVIKENDASGVNGVREYTWKSVLPYELKFKMRLVEKDAPKHMRGEAFGELEGVGVWSLEEKDGITFVQYNWNVITNKAWMNWFSFLLKPLFKYNHDVVMRWGAEGLAKKLNAELIAA